MAELPSLLRERIVEGKNLVVAELSPPQSGDPGPLRAAAASYAGKIHALGIGDNQHGVCMSALAAASLVAQQGVEPILHVVTRDRNRTALVSDYLGAQALGIRNVLCTSGTHHTLDGVRAARAVFDVDAVQLLQTYAGLGTDASLVGADRLNGTPTPCLGAVASPFADPQEMQLIRLNKKIQAGAQFCITQPVFDLKGFEVWWQQVVDHGLHKKTAILAGIQILTSAQVARAAAERHPRTRIPDTFLSKITAPSGSSAQRAAGIELAVELVRGLASLPGLRGFELRGGGDHDAVLEVMAQAELGAA